MWQNRLQIKLKLNFVIRLPLFCLFQDSDLARADGATECVRETARVLPESSFPISRAYYFGNRYGDVRGRQSLPEEALKAPLSPLFARK